MKKRRLRSEKKRDLLAILDLLAFLESMVALRDAAMGYTEGGGPWAVVLSFFNDLGKDSPGDASTRVINDTDDDMITEGYKALSVHFENMYTLSLRCSEPYYSEHLIPGYKEICEAMQISEDRNNV